MREILFRGKRVDNGEWVEGLPFFEENRCYIIEDLFICDEYQCTGAVNSSVIPETVGQYTGLTDKNGKKIFEGDIVTVTHPHLNANGFVYFQNGTYFINHISKVLSLYAFNAFGEVIGNIHDNPELLEGQEND